MSSSAPWRSETTSVPATSTRLHDIEQRLAQLEAIILPQGCIETVTGPIGAFTESSLAVPPSATLPTALNRIFTLRENVRTLMREFRLVYAFLLRKFPFASEDMSAIVESWSPESDEPCTPTAPAAPVASCDTMVPGVCRVGDIVVAAAPPEAPLPAAAFRSCGSRPAEDRSGEEIDEFPEDFPDDDDEEAAGHHGRPWKRQRNR